MRGEDMKKGFSAFLVGVILMLSACGGGGAETKTVSLTDEELIVAAQNIHFEGYEEKTIKEYMDGSEAYPDCSWYIVSEENTESGALEDIMDTAVAKGFDAEKERLVCFKTTINRGYPEFYFAVDTATGEARILYSYTDWSDDLDFNTAYLLNTKEIGSIQGADALQAAAEGTYLPGTVNIQGADALVAAAEGAYLPGYTEKTIGEYAHMATILAGSYRGQIFVMTSEQEVLPSIQENCDDFDIEKDILVSFSVRKEDLNGASTVKYIFYIGVDRDTGEAAVYGVNISDGNKSRTFYGNDVKEIADIFVKAANWAE